MKRLMTLVMAIGFTLGAVNSLTAKSGCCNNCGCGCCGKKNHGIELTTQKADVADKCSCNRPKPKP